MHTVSCLLFNNRRIRIGSIVCSLLLLSVNSVFAQSAARIDAIYVDNITRSIIVGGAYLNNTPTMKVILGEAGMMGPMGLMGLPGTLGATGPESTQGIQGAAIPQGPSGTGYARTQAIFGTGPITHFDADGFKIDSPDAATIRLTNTAGGFLDFGLSAPTGCSVPTSTGATTTNTSQTFRFSFGAGETSSASLCTEGSMVLVTVHSQAAGVVRIFQCQRHTSNANVCQRLN